MKYEFTIKGTLPNLNDYIDKLNINKFRGAELKKDSEKYISAFINKYLIGIKISRPVFIAITWFEPNKLRDKDNIAFAKKFIFDALVTNKVLSNDGWGHIVGFTDNFSVDRSNPRIEVTIEEIY